MVKDMAKFSVSTIEWLKTLPNLLSAPWNGKRLINVGKMVKMVKDMAKFSVSTVEW